MMTRSGAMGNFSPAANKRAAAPAALRVKAITLFDAAHRKVLGTEQQFAINMADFTMALTAPARALEVIKF